ncbi:MAG: GcrA family cell cycle regulator, partial [Pseudomonadota bacterium]|nr:GcrA family cell cycle regulator [Pseudomonadota bacterium]
PLVMPEPAVTADGEPINILSLSEKVCKWPIGEPGEEDFRFCGNNKVNGSPYCTEHTKVAYQPLENRKRKNKFVNKKKPLPKVNNF